MSGRDIFRKYQHLYHTVPLPGCLQAEQDVKKNTWLAMHLSPYSKIVHAYSVKGSESNQNLDPLATVCKKATLTRRNLVKPDEN